MMRPIAGIARSPVRGLGRVARSWTLRNAAKLLSGRVVAMGVSLGSAPVVARLFAPEDYGVAALFLALITMLAAVLASGYHRAVLIPRDDGTAARLFLLSIFSCFFLTGLTYLVLLATALASPHFLTSTALSNLIWLGPLSALILACRDASMVLLLRRGRFASIAGVDILQSTTVAGTRVGWGLLFGSSAFGLIFGQLAGFAAALLMALGGTSRWLERILVKWTWREIWKLATQFKDYPIFRVTAQLAFIGGAQLPVIALSMMYSSGTVGFYAMAHRVAALPLQAASQSLSETILKKSINQHNHRQKIEPGLKRAVAALAVTGIPAFLCMSFLGEELLTWLLGSRWQEAGLVLELLAISLFFQWMAAPFYALLEALRKNKTQLFLYCANVAALAATFLICHVHALSFWNTLWAFIVVSIIHQILVMVLGALALYEHDRHLCQEPF